MRTNGTVATLEQTDKDPGFIPLSLANGNRKEMFLRHPTASLKNLCQVTHVFQDMRNNNGRKQRLN